MQNPTIRIEVAALPIDGTFEPFSLDDASIVHDEPAGVIYVKHRGNGSFGVIDVRDVLAKIATWQESQAGYSAESTRRVNAFEQVECSYSVGIHAFKPGAFLNNDSGHVQASTDGKTGIVVGPNQSPLWPGRPSVNAILRKGNGIVVATQPPTDGAGNFNYYVDISTSELENVVRNGVRDMEIVTL